MIDTLLLAIGILSAFMLVTSVLVPYWLRLGLWLTAPQEPQCAKIRKVSIIMPVFNEEHYIVKRSLNVKDSLAQIAHPHEVSIGSDGSQDKTLQLAREFIDKHQLANWKVLDFPNEGKGRTINKLVHQSTGDLIISTDADVSMDPHSIDLIIKSFEADGGIGCLSCVPEFPHGHNTQSFYWDIEMKIREAESQMGKLIVVTGWLYAFRTTLFKDIPATAMADDLWVPLTILIQGFKCIHHKQLKAFSEKTDEGTEVKRRERVISGGADIIKRLFLPLLKEPALFMIVVFHKINRWLIPFWCLMIILTSLWLMPDLFIVYAFGIGLLTIVMTPQRLAYLIQSLISPVLSVFSMTRKKDLSKWDKTRIS